VSDFQLILLRDVQRPVRKAEPSSTFSLIRYRSRAEWMAEKLALTPQTIANWLNPRDTEERLGEVIKNGALVVPTLLNRVRAGLIQTAAMYSVWENPDRFDQSSSDKPVLIPAEHWAFYHHLEIEDQYALWDTGDICFEMGTNEGFDTVSVRYFGVRFDPAGIEEMIASAAPTRPRISHPAPSPLAFLEQLTRREQPEPEEPQVGPPVSPEHLRAWFELYQRAYSGAADTEANALASARGMFPDKMVSRERIRELRGSQKRGRKPGEAAK
jgi:hypothetical protein